MITLQDAVDDLYRMTVIEERGTSTKRLDVLADYCVQELSSRGLAGAAKEVQIPGIGRRPRAGMLRGQKVARSNPESA